MFKFGFSRDDEAEESNIDSRSSTISWIPASRVEVSSLRTEEHFESEDYTEIVIHSGLKLKLIRSEKVLLDLTRRNSHNIVEAESQHSDLVPAIYEGGLKIWECSYDLCQYLLDNNVDLRDKMVLDLGCGAGVVGLAALLKNSFVHFQDYNVEVIDSTTVPNVLLNFEDRWGALSKCEFYCGDWESFATLSHGDTSVMYDLILTSETIYNPDNHKKLYEVFKHRLKHGGTGYVAGKSYYFGVGGGMRQFQSLVEEDGFFDVVVAWKSREGLQREILKLTRREGR